VIVGILVLVNYLFAINVHHYICCWSDGLELVARQSTRPGAFFLVLWAESQLKTFLFSSRISVHSALYAYSDYYAI